MQVINTCHLLMLSKGQDRHSTPTKYPPKEHTTQQYDHNGKRSTVQSSNPAMSLHDHMRCPITPSIVPLRNLKLSKPFQNAIGHNFDKTSQHAQVPTLITNYTHTHHTHSLH